VLLLVDFPDPIEPVNDGDFSLVGKGGDLPLNEADDEATN